MLLLFTARKPGDRSDRALIRWCLFTLCSFLFFAIGWSPQYELYVIPLILLAFDDPFVGAGAALLVQAITFLEYPLLLPWAYFYGGSAVWLAWSATLARYLVLGWLALYVFREEASLAALRERLAGLRWLRPHSRLAVHAVAAAVAIGLLAAPAPTRAATGRRVRYRACAGSPRPSPAQS